MAERKLLKIKEYCLLCSCFGDLDDDYQEGSCFRERRLADPVEWCEKFEMNEY